MALRFVSSGLFFAASLSIASPLADVDAPFSVPTSQLAASVVCPNGIKKAAGGIVFLIHGTGSTGDEAWPGTPYTVLLPTAGPGFDVCWVNLPNRSLGDAQISAEYVAYNIPILAAQSATGKIAIIGHSQGAGLNPQWALNFWPSTRQYVSDYIALAGDFHGTDEGALACLAGALSTGGCAAAVIQQTAGSKYLAAQNKRGGSALVTTTSIYTRYDDVVQDEVVNPTSILSGATNIALQDLNICGLGHIVNHFGMVTDPAAYGLALDALTHDGAASAARFDRTYCTYFKDNVNLNFANTALIIRGEVLDALAVVTGNGQAVKQEPVLKKYVCDQGQATVCGSV